MLTCFDICYLYHLQVIRNILTYSVRLFLIYINHSKLSCFYLFIYFLFIFYLFIEMSNKAAYKN
jgi:hypothetical protein